MNIKFRLTILNFFEFFVFGAWLISLGGYLGGQLHFSGTQIGKIFMTLGLASIIMPAIVGIIADKYLNAQKLLGIIHILGAGFLFYLSLIKDYDAFFWVMLGYLMLYMPTIGLANAVSYSILDRIFIIIGHLFFYPAQSTMFSITKQITNRAIGS